VDTKNPAEPAVRIRLLGGFEATGADGHALAPGAWRLRKARSLVKLLALAPGRLLHREQVIDALWPEAEAEAGRNNLHQVVHAARRAIATLNIDPTTILRTHDDVLDLSPAVATDVEQLQAAVREAQAAGAREEISRLLRDSPAELLPEDAYEPWMQTHIAAFREWRTQLVMDMAEAHLNNAEADQAVVLLSPVVAADPLHEPAVRALMRALAEIGRRSEALQVYERLRDVLQDELGADPEPSTRQLFSGLLQAGAQGPPVRLPAPRAGGNLPAPVTALVGRFRELSEIRAILTRTRLLTLTGMGGVGKTTLAVEIARQVAGEFPGGAFLLELGALTDPSQLAPHVARTLHLHLPPEADPLEAVLAQVRHRRILLVLDNCEHLLAGCAELVSELMRNCSQLQVVTTSREALRISGEVSWRTPSLELPDPHAVPAAAQLAAVASVELFVRRAQGAVSDFALTDENAAAVAEICYRLDGIPLALELAAGCLPVLSPAQIADRLGDALNLLRRGDRASVTRQQTLAATLKWSSDLLDPPAQRLFRRLAAFAGSFDLSAVESVCADSETDVLSALARLVDSSLVVVESAGNGVRYRLLETVRQYAVDLLRAAGEQDQLRRRHGEWYAGLARTADPEIPLAAGSSSVRLDVEHDNLRAALSWALTVDHALALEIAVSLWRYWLARGHYAEGGRTLEAVLAACPEPSPLRARALFALAAFDVRRGSDGRLQALGAEAVRIIRGFHDPYGLAQALHSDAVLAFMRGDWEGSWTRSNASREAAVASRAPHRDIAPMHLQGLVLHGQGRLEEAFATFEEVRRALDILPTTTRPFLPPLLLGFSVEQPPGDGEAVQIYFEETILLGRLVGVEQARAYVLCNLADVARLDGRPSEALRLVQEAAERFVQLNDSDGEALALSRLGCLLRAEGDLVAARNALQASLRLRRALGDRRATGLSHGNLGVLAAAEGDLPAGMSLVGQALAIARETQDGAASVGLTLTLASLRIRAGQHDEVVSQLSAALARSAHIPGNSRVTAWAYLQLGAVLTRLGRGNEAAEAYDEAAARFTALGCVDGRAALRVLRVPHIAL
jgi:predicted ATPase/DNA-binding SARP family transcriptional activator